MIADIPPIPPYIHEKIDKVCSSITYQYVKYADEDVADKTEEKERKFGKSSIRLKAIKETGFLIGSQNGVKWEYNAIKNALVKIKDHLDSVFNFSYFITDKSVLYPVLEEAGDGFVQQGNDMASFVKKTYRIVKPAKVVSAPPNWRQWLLNGEPMVNHVKVPDGLKPIDEKEMQLWKKSICKGFKRGMDITFMDFMDRVDSLVHDYKGMLLYQELVLKNMVEMPKVQEGSLGIIRSPDGQRIDIGHKYIQIKENSKFKEHKDWKVFLKKKY